VAGEHRDIELVEITAFRLEKTKSSPLFTRIEERRSGRKSDYYDECSMEMPKSAKKASFHVDKFAEIALGKRLVQFVVL